MSTVTTVPVIDSPRVLAFSPLISDKYMGPHGSI